MPVKYDEFVKRPLAEMEYTPEQVIELKDSSDDIIHFTKYVKIVNPDRGVVNFSDYIYPHQKKMLISFDVNRFHVCLLPRQISGKTTTVGIYALHYAIFKSNKNIGIVANKEKTAIMILSRIKKMYERLPVWLKPGIVEYARTSVLFDNGTRIVVSATSPDALRGWDISLLILDEFAFVPKNAANEFWASNYPTIFSSVESKIIVISTPNGMFNPFHELFSKAERKENSFIPVKVHWTEIPGRTQEWADQAKRDLGEQRYRQEIETLFLGSTNTLINPHVLETIVGDWVEPEIKELDDRFCIYEKVDGSATYIIGVDTAKGTGEHYSTIQVLKVLDSKLPELQQVAVFNDNNTDVYEFANIVNRVSLYYNKSHLMVENNAEGSTIVNVLWWDLENERLVNTGSKTVNLGIRAKRNTKPKAVLLMKKLIEDGMLKIVDKETLNQLTMFIENNGKFYGKDGPDDLVSALYWACFIFEMDVFDERVSFVEDKIDKDADDGAWGILNEIDDIINDWDFSWMDESRYTN